MGWHEVLLPYRAEDNFRGAAMVAQDKNLLRLAATWPRVRRTMPPYCEQEQNTDLDDLWRRTIVDFDHWASLAQLKPVAVIQGFRALKGNRIILPDGTINHLVDTLLQKEAAGEMMAKLGIKAGDLK